MDRKDVRYGQFRRDETHDLIKKELAFFFLLGKKTDARIRHEGIPLRGKEHVKT